MTRDRETTFDPEHGTKSEVWKSTVLPMPVEVSFPEVSRSVIYQANRSSLCIKEEHVKTRIEVSLICFVPGGKHMIFRLPHLYVLRMLVVVSPVTGDTAHVLCITNLSFLPCESRASG